LLVPNENDPAPPVLPPNENAGFVLAAAAGARAFAKGNMLGAFDAIGGYADTDGFVGDASGRGVGVATAGWAAASLNGSALGALVAIGGYAVDAF